MMFPPIDVGFCITDKQNAAGVVTPAAFDLV